MFRLNTTKAIDALGAVADEEYVGSEPFLPLEPSHLATIQILAFINQKHRAGNTKLFQLGLLHLDIISALMKSK